MSLTFIAWSVLMGSPLWATTLSPQVRLEIRARCYVWNPEACTEKTKKADAELIKNIRIKEKPNVAAKRISQFAWLVLKQRKAPQLALQRFNQAAILDPTLADPWWGAGESYLALEMEDEAERVLGEAVKLDSKAIGPLLTLAALRERQGKFEEAEKFLAMALDRDPKSGSTAFELARLLANQRKIEDAKKAYKRALSLGAKPNAELEKKLN